MPSVRSASKQDAAVLGAIARKGRRFIALPEDRPWLEQVIDNPNLQVSRMANRGTLESLGWGRYLVLPDGATSARQAASLPVLVAALMHGRGAYYLGFLSALANHELTDETVNEIYIAVRGRRAPRQRSLLGRPVQFVRLLDTAEWPGVERQRAEGRSFYFRSSVERTLLDTLDHPEHCGATETWVRAWERAFRLEKVDVGEMLDQALERRPTTTARAAFWLRELGRVRESRLLLRAVGAPLRGARLLDLTRPFGEGPWRRDRETGLIMNLPEAAVTGWLEYGK